MTTRLTLEPWRTVAPQVEAAAVLHVGEKSMRLWWRVPETWRHALTSWADPFVVGLLFPMMQAGKPVRVEGPVSPSLLENLEHYMAIWSCWVPERYRAVEIRADHEIEAPASAGDTFLCTFSGGSDSAYTLLRHLRREAGRRTKKIGAAVIMDGFDVWHDQANAAHIFEGIHRDALAQLGPLGVTSIKIDSNFHELPVVWGEAFGTHLISGLRLLANGFRGTLIPNNQKYNVLPHVWGSTPLIDRYLSSENFPIIDDGGEVARHEKIAYVAQVPGLLDHLRVCFPLDGRYQNCGICEKCIRTILAFHVAGIPIPSTAFPKKPTLRQIARMKFQSEMTRQLWIDLLRFAKVNGKQHEAWAEALAIAVRRGRRRHRWQQFSKPFIPLRNQIRILFRGSPENRKKRKPQ